MFNTMCMIDRISVLVIKGKRGTRWFLIWFQQRKKKCNVMSKIIEKQVKISKCNIIEMYESKEKLHNKKA